jgi:nicotinamide-nucleotide amidase
MNQPDPRQPIPAVPDQTLALAQQLRNLLQEQTVRLVLAESCTAGRVAATLGLLPGISQWLCGSFVVYRSSSKTDWLQVPAELLADPHIGPVSAQASRALAAAALAHTPEADVAIAVTGDVGPGAPRATDGQIFLAYATRKPNVSSPCPADLQMQLHCLAPIDADDLAARYARLEEATQNVLRFAVKQLSALNRC